MLRILAFVKSTAVYLETDRVFDMQLSLPAEITRASKF